jgi:hypothetical protein
LGLDRLMLSFALGAVALLAAGCAHAGSRPTRLLDGRAALAFAPVRGSIIAAGRVLTRASLGRRLDSCLFPGDRKDVPPDEPVVERVGVDGESLTVANSERTQVFACDGGVDPAGERTSPWCHAVSGELEHGQLLDPRLDVLCRDRRRRPLAYVFVEPVPAAQWIGVREGGYVELYEVLAGLPVRVAGTHDVDPEEARATLEITQYDAEGRLLVEGKLEAVVAG